MKRFFLLIALLLPATLLTGGFAHGASDIEIIGTFKKVLNDIYGTTVEGERERKFPRYDVTFGEYIQTSGGAATLIKLSDDTELYLGERAELTIDEFVYDPKSGKASALYKFNVGALRFISGGSTEGKVAIVTPTAFIGIRGSEALIFVTPDGGTFVNVFEGRFNVRSRDRDDRVSKPISVTKGRNVSVSKSGAISKVAEGVAVPDDSKNKNGKMTKFKADLNMLKKDGRIERSRKTKMRGDYSEDDDHGDDDHHHDDHDDHHD